MTSPSDPDTTVVPPWTVWSRVLVANSHRRWIIEHWIPVGTCPDEFAATMDVWRRLDGCGRYGLSAEFLALPAGQRPVPLGAA